jgi:hypothetical protein
MMPFTFQSMVLAQISDLYQYGGPEALQDGIGALALYTSRVLMDTPGLTSVQATGKLITDVSGATNRPEVMQKLRKATGKTLVTMIPGSTVAKQVTKGLADDEYQKEAMDILDGIMLTYPGLNTEGLGFKRDPLSGMLLSHDFETGNLIVDKLHKTGATDRVNREIVAQRVKVPEISPAYMGRNLAAYHNSATKTPWHDRLKAAIMEVKPSAGERFGGLDLYEALGSLMDTEEYKAQSVRNRGKTALSTGEIIFNKNTKEELLKGVIEDYRNLAREKIGEEIRAAASKGDIVAQDFLKDAKKQATVGVTVLK